jgi:hypothetical protein
MDRTVPVPGRKREFLAGEPLKPSVAMSGSLSRKLSSDALLANFSVGIHPLRIAV